MFGITVNRGLNLVDHDLVLAHQVIRDDELLERYRASELHVMASTMVEADLKSSTGTALSDSLPTFPKQQQQD